MNATKIFDTQELPGRHLHSTAQFSLSQYGNGRLIIESRQEVARACAELIVNDGDFFDYKERFGYATVRVDVVVMTQQELRQLMRNQFEAGQNHAIYNQPVYPQEVQP